jgi:aldehyde:ferredoxin oxidoreductase
MQYAQTKLNHGYADRILTIDLGSGQIQASAIDPGVREYLIGGRKRSNESACGNI